MPQPRGDARREPEVARERVHDAGLGVVHARDADEPPRRDALAHREERRHHAERVPDDRVELAVLLAELVDRLGVVEHGREPAAGVAVARRVERDDRGVRLERPHDAR